MDEALTSAHSFVRALKASSDPPQENWPTKIHIAKAVWENTSICIPRKAGIILEWLLPLLTRTKFKVSSEAQPVLNPLYWEVLADVLSQPGDTPISSFVSRFSIVSSLHASFLAFTSLSPESAKELFTQMHRSLTILWPLSTHNLDALSEAFWASVSLIKDSHGLVNSHVAEIITRLWNTFREKLTSSYQKKKIYTLFLQHLNDWLSALQFDIEGIPAEQLYQIGRDILYNSDNLKSMVDTKQNKLNLLSSILPSDGLKSDQTARHSLLKILPRLYKDYLTSLHNYQDAILPPSLNAAEARERLAEAGTDFVMEMIRYLENLEGLEDQSQLWNLIFDILIIAEQKEIAAVKDETAWMLQLRSLRQRGLSLLDKSWDERHVPLLEHVLDILSFLHRIEPELINPVLPGIVERIALSSSRLSRPALTFLKQVLTFYSKTRTLHIFLAILHDVMNCSFPLASDISAQKLHEISIRSPLMSLTFLDELRYALLAYVSPGQAKALIQSVEGALRGAIEGYSPATKRRKLSGKSAPVGSREPEMDIVAFSLVTRLDSAVLETLSRRNISDYTQDLTNCIYSLDGCTSTALNQLFPSLKDHVLNDQALSKKRKLTKTQFDWLNQCFLASLLQLSYSLIMQCGEDGSRQTLTAIFNHIDVMIALMEKEMMAELQLEIGRWLIYVRLDGIHDQDSQNKCIGALLDFIERHGTVQVDSSNDRGFAYLDSSGHVAFVLLGFILESCLPTINVFASQVQLERIVRLILRQMSCGSQPKNPLSMEVIIDRLCQTGSFWEMQSIKGTLQTVLENETSLLTSKHVVIRPDMDWSMLTQSMQCSSEYLECNANLYNYLLRFPSNYLSRNSRDDLISKALNADVFIRIGGSKAFSSSYRPNIGVPFRAFLSKCWNEYPSRTLEEIVSDPSWIDYVFGKEFSGENRSLWESSKGIQTVWLKSALGHALKGEASPLEAILQTSLNLVPITNQNLNDNLIYSPVVLIINSIVHNVENIRLSQSTISLLNQLCMELGRCLGKAIGQLLQEDNVMLFSSHGLIRGWKAFLSLSAWISGELAGSPETKAISQKLFRRTMSSCIASSAVGEFYSDVLSIALLQIKLSPKIESLDLAEILAGYLLITSVKTSQACDEPLSRFCKKSTLDQYRMLLDILGECLEVQTRKTALAAALHASILFLKEAPEKSSKVTSVYVSRCLRVLTNIDHPQLHSSDICKISEFLHFQCSERAVTLTTLDVGEVLTIIHSITDGSHEHDTHTSYSTFNTIVSTLDNLVRLRHDLLNSFFPHISKILCRLILLLRISRPQLGTKQYRLIASEYPRWINPLDSCSTPEATTLARLLTTFTTKTSVRSRGNDETPSATSLARSFARHAPYVLLAYLQAVSDPLVFLPAQARKGLQPGLFALCAMTGEHGRDTLMVQNLTAEQQILLKTLWGDYAKQRYTGKG